MATYQLRRKPSDKIEFGSLKTILFVLGHTSAKDMVSVVKLNLGLKNML